MVINAVNFSTVVAMSFLLSLSVGMGAKGSVLLATQREIVREIVRKIVGKADPKITVETVVEEREPQRKRKGSIVVAQGKVSQKLVVGISSTNLVVLISNDFNYI